MRRELWRNTGKEAQKNGVRSTVFGFYLEIKQQYERQDWTWGRIVFSGSAFKVIFFFFFQKKKAVLLSLTCFHFQRKVH